MLATERCLMTKQRRSLRLNPSEKLPVWCSTKAVVTVYANMREILGRSAPQATEVTHYAEEHQVDRRSL